MNQAWTKFLPATLRAKVEGRAYLQNVVSNAGWQFADHLLRMGVGLAVGIWVARYLGPGQFGLFSFALAFVALFSAFATLGLEDIVIRNIVRDPACREETLGTAFFLSLSGGVVVFLAVMGTILLLHPGDELNHWLVGIIALGAIFQSLYVIEIWFHSQVQAKYVVFAKNGAFLFCSLLKALLIITGQPLLAFAWIATLEVAVGSAGLILAYTSLGNRVQDWRFSAARAGSLLKDSWPLLFSGIVIIVYMRIDQVMLGEMIGSEEVGIYSVAVRLAEVWMFIPQVIFWSVFPAVVEARVSDETLLYERLQKLYNLMALAAYAVAIPMTLLAGWLVDTLFGAAYTRAGAMLAVLVWANVFSNLEIARSSFLSSMNWTRIHFVAVLLGCLLNIALNFLLIPRYGGMGAVIASVVAYWFAAHGTCFLFRPLFRTGAMLTKAMLYPKIW
jgi:O-antigen/teichoic acid export membrane protein